MIAKFILKIKRKRTPFYSLLHRLGKLFYSINLPTIKAIHLPLYYFDYIVRLMARRFVQTVWSVPLFKARCEKVGKHLSLPNGIPYIIGTHLKIYIDDNVILDKLTIGAGKVFDEPVLRVGNNSVINYGTAISVAKEVIIGDNCMISTCCLIMDSDDHPISPEKRLLKLPVNKEDVKPVRIGNNVWIGANSTILKGVTIGDNSIVATRSVVTKNIPANCIFGNEPARLIKKEIHKPDADQTT
ncbi:MAG: acyltransferase [Desulfobacteraceae bacterium]|nr:acyltransferase [Desulfobacteraceae bacterium]MBC2720373.1 acyltransferase [Desulfobacteraceae bacterium]